MVIVRSTTVCLLVMFLLALPFWLPLTSHLSCNVPVIIEETVHNLNLWFLLEIPFNVLGVRLSSYQNICTRYPLQCDCSEIFPQQLNIIILSGPWSVEWWAWRTFTVFIISMSLAFRDPCSNYYHTEQKTTYSI